MIEKDFLLTLFFFALLFGPAILNPVNAQSNVPPLLCTETTEDCRYFEKAGIQERSGAMANGNWDYAASINLNPFSDNVSDTLSVQHWRLPNKTVQHWRMVTQSDTTCGTREVTLPCRYYEELKFYTTVTTPQ